MEVKENILYEEIHLNNNEKKIEILKKKIRKIENSIKDMEFLCFKIVGSDRIKIMSDEDLNNCQKREKIFIFTKN